MFSKTLNSNQPSTINDFVEILLLIRLTIRDVKLQREKIIIFNFLKLMAVWFMFKIENTDTSSSFTTI